MMTFWHVYNVPQNPHLTNDSCFFTLCSRPVSFCGSENSLHIIWHQVNPKDSLVTISWPVWPHSFVSPKIFKMNLLLLDCRQLLHLNFFPFFGTMIIVLEKMIKETAIFFLLLAVIAAGFLQSFVAY